MPEFFVVLKDELLPVNVPDNVIITAIFRDLKSSSATARRIFGHLTSFDQYQYFKLKNPVPLPHGAFDIGEVARTCLNESNWEQVHPHYSLAVLSTTLATSHVYLVIQPKQDAVEQAIADLTSPSPLATIPEGAGNDEAQDNLGVFGADDIQCILESTGHKINFILFGFPLVASIPSVTDEFKMGYLKFVRDGGTEIEILRYLMGLDSLKNHTISGAQIWPVHGGNVISMPVAGSWLTSLKKPSAHLWSVAKQLFEAVDFMHQHNVAHMDLKPQNILIPLDGGRLSIINFGRSLRVSGVGHKFRGIVGTTGYIPPEVAGSGDFYSAIRADLWSCGKTLEELCNTCLPSVDRDTLLEISRQLMDEDPNQRPMMSDVMDRLTRTVDATPSAHTGFYSVVPPEVNA